jgi:hypothetical protein
VQATAKGRGALSRARRRRIDAFAARLRDLTKEELATLASAAELIERAVAQKL